MMLARLTAAFRPRTADHEAGQAMIIVIGVIMLALLIPIGVFYQANQQLPLARHDQDFQAAIAAAESGVDDFLNRLDQNQNYWSYSATNPPPDGNLAFTQWVNMPGSAPGANTGQFRYTTDTSQLAKSGILYLTSSGQSNGVVRTVKVGMRRQSFLDYLYFTNYETMDPARYSNPFTAQQRCPYWAYQPNPYTGGNGPDPSYCNFIYFVSADNLNGPVHSNDDLYICGTPHFNGPVDTSDAPPVVPGRITNACGGSGPVWFRNGDPAYQPNIPFPPANNSIKGQTTIGQAGAGCLFTGPTTITLASNGTMTVTSPGTKSTNSGCLGTNPIPADGVIYVQNVPSSKTDPNYTANCATAISNPIQTSGTDVHNGCSGDAIVKGTLAGQLTIAADNDVVLTGSVTYAGGLGGSDVLGLIANNFVEINHPSGSYCSGGTGVNGAVCNPTIDAAILSVNHSFMANNYAQGSPLGTLTINGALGQQFRGPVGTTSGGSIVSGYAKNYNYDQRLHYLSPPYLLDPFQTAWEKVSFAELAPAY